MLINPSEHQTYFMVYFNQEGHMQKVCQSDSIILCRLKINSYGNLCLFFGPNKNTVFESMGEFKKISI